ncbi:MAG: right-handed parallel beta-helix repeat-containing protein, partial [Bdellovibrionales bacterium]|nr:right-handed parallel beta-helix repeat-containing protein [Bdellovibrionales bacterium]NQZ18155.1 right-handed parallel beta-helix repeat-containing protein [Bdellovibrionales bacterium]
MNVKLILSFSVFFLSTISNAQDVNDCTSFQVATLRKGNYSYSTDLASSLSNAQDNDQIFLGSSSFGKVTIEGKSNLKLHSSCSAKIRMIVINNSNAIELKSLELDANNTDRAAVRIKDSSQNITIVDSKVTNSKNGISFENSTNLTLINNEILNNANDGIILEAAKGQIEIKQNTISENKRGMLVQTSDANGSVVVEGNTISKHPWAGIRVKDSNAMLNFTNNNISESLYGIRLFDNVASSQVSVSGNTLAANQNDGLILSGSFEAVTASSNTISNNKRGVLIQNSNASGSVELSNNNISGHQWANVRVSKTSSDLKFSNNTMSDGLYGIRLFDNVNSGIVEFVSNSLKENKKDGLIVNGSFDEVKISSNTIEDNKRGILLQNIKDSGKTDLENNTIKGHEWAGVRVDTEANNITFTGNEITENNDGVRLAEDLTSGSVSFIDNKLNQNGKNGLWIKGRVNVALTNNELNGNGTDGKRNDGYGIKKNVDTDASAITLVGNQIINNSGRVRNGLASIDLFDFTEILDVTDSGNSTTNNNEGPGVGESDTQAPTILTSLESGNLIVNLPFNLEININDVSPTTTKIFLNGTQVSQFEGSQENLDLNFNQGNNIVRIESADSFGNSSVKEITDIFVDSLGPVLALNYQDGESVSVDSSGIVEFSIQTN